MSDCRDCIYKHEIYEFGNEYHCGKSGLDFEDGVCGPTCNCREFYDSYNYIKDQDAIQECHKDDLLAAVVFGGDLLSDDEEGQRSDALVPCVVFIFGAIMALGIWERLSISDSPIAITIKGLISLSILYKIFLKWVWKFLSFIYKEMCEQATRDKIDMFGATLVTSLFVTWVFTWIYDVRYFFESYVVIAFLIHRFCIKSLMQALREKLKR